MLVNCNNCGREILTEADKFIYQNKPDGEYYSCGCSIHNLKIRDYSNVQKQTLLNENGECGDCWRCCIAAILGLPHKKVPHFVQLYDFDFEHETAKWLKRMGYWLVATKEIRNPNYDTNIKREWPLITLGETSRNTKSHHAVITQGGKLVYDPHPSNDGLTKVVRHYLIVKAYE